MYRGRKSEEYRSMEIEETFNTCRLCLSGNDGLIHVFETGSFGYAPADVIVMLLQLEVSANDRYPQYVCVGCLGKLGDFKKFKEQCEGCKELLDRAYAARSKSLPVIKPNEVESQVSPLSKITGDDSQVPNEEQMVLCQEEETDPLGDLTDIKPSVLELNDGFYGVEDEHDGEGYNHEVERCAEEVSTDCPVTVHSGMSTSLPLAEPQTVEIVMAEQEEEDCPQDSGISNEVSRSIEKKGEERIVFRCSECGKEYLCARSYDGHVALHRFGKTLKCAHCEKYFVNKRSISVHIKRHFEEQLNCKVCGKTCKNMKVMKSHWLNVHGDKNFKCDICEKRFASNGKLNEHERVHVKGDNRVCDICGKTFDNSVHFQRHLYTHKYRGKRRKKYACGVCDQKCYTPSRLAMHLRSHTKEKPFPCPTCGKCFAVKYNLEAHIKSQHSECGLNKVQCDQCGRSYSTVQYLRKHKRIRHMGSKEFK